MRKLIVLLVLLTLNFGVFAQGLFVKEYKYRTSKIYNESTEAYDVDFGKKLPTTIVFNINNSNDAKIIFSVNSEVLLYLVTKDDVQDSNEYITFTAYLSNGDKVNGAMNDDWFVWSYGKYLWSYQNFAPEL